MWRKWYFWNKILRPNKSPYMKLKFFTIKDSGNITEDEAASNDWLQDNPNIAILEKIQRSAIENGKLRTMISVWYEEDKKVGYISGNWINDIETW